MNQPNDDEMMRVVIHSSSQSVEVENERMNESKCRWNGSFLKVIGGLLLIAVISAGASIGLYLFMENNKGKNDVKNEKHDATNRSGVSPTAPKVINYASVKDAEDALDILKNANICKDERDDKLLLSDYEFEAVPPNESGKSYFKNLKNGNLIKFEDEQDSAHWMDRISLANIEWVYIEEWEITVGDFSDISKKLGKINQTFKQELSKKHPSDQLKVQVHDCQHYNEYAAPSPMKIKIVVDFLVDGTNKHYIFGDEGVQKDVRDILWDCICEMQKKDVKQERWILKPAQ